jgi:hypothetical protein
MQNFFKSHKKFCLLAFVLFDFGLILFLLLLIPSTRYATKSTLQALQAHLTLPANGAFPDVDKANLSPVQKNIVTITKAEYAKHPVSFDTNVLKYSQNNKESWCADYASWVLKQAGAPLSNPNSGSWRIPGVLTLQSYFQNQNRYKTVGEYKPKTGDLAIYVGKRTLDGSSKQHTNIVLSVSGDTMTTIGGNEVGRMRISTQSYKTGQNSLVGFGTL